MGIKLITAPATEPVTLAEAKAQLSISDSIQDDIITRHIVGARQYAENYTGRAFIDQTWELALDHFPSEIALPRMPVSSITSIKYYDDNGAEQTLSASLYGLDNYSPTHWVLREADTEWPTTYAMSNAVKVRFVAGYGSAGSDVPTPIRQAILLTVGHWIDFQRDIQSGMQSPVTMVPRAVDHLLSQYKLMRL